MSRRVVARLLASGVLAPSRLAPAASQIPPWGLLGIVVFGTLATVFWAALMNAPIRSIVCRHFAGHVATQSCLLLFGRLGTRWVT